MKTFNVTASIYQKNDSSKQNVFMNEIILAPCESDARKIFYKQLELEYFIIKISSIEEVTHRA